MKMRVTLHCFSVEVEKHEPGRTLEYDSVGKRLGAKWSDLTTEAGKASLGMSRQATFSPSDENNCFIVKVLVL